MTDQTDLRAPTSTIRPLVVSTEPRTDEGLSSVLVRACEANVFPNVFKLLELIGINALASDSVPFTHANASHAIARLIGTTTAAVENRMHPAVRDDTNRRLARWYGDTIERRHLEGELRRYAPRSLEQSEHFRALWSVRLLDYCPVTMERLLSACPSCSQPLQWRGCRFITKCNKCGASLLSAKSRSLPPELHEAARLGAALVDTSESARKRALSSLPNPLSGWASADALVGLLALGEAQIWLDGNGQSSPPESAPCIAAGLEFVSYWPDSMARYVKDSTIKTNSTSLTQGLGPLGKFFAAKARSGPLRDLFRENISAWLGEAVVPAKLSPGSAINETCRAGTITALTAIQRLKISLTHLRRLEGRSNTFVARHDVKGGAALYDEAAIGRLKEALDSGLNRYDAARLLGIQHHCIDALVSAGLISWVANEDVEIVKGTKFLSRPSIRELRVNLRKRSTDLEKSISLRTAMQRNGDPNVWVTVLQGMLAGRIAVQIEDDETLPLSDTMFVRSKDIAAQMSGRCEGDGIDGVSVSCQAAAEIIGTTAQCMAEAADVGFIPGRIGFRNYALPLRAILQLQKRSIFTDELRERFGKHPKAIAAELRLAGLAPEATIYRVNVWRRSVIDGYLRDSADLRDLSCDRPRSR